MFNKLPMYQNIGDSAYKKDLSNIILICEHLNNPQNNFKSIHIGGTNGKGSCSHMLSSIIQEANYKVGLYTSPHLVDFRERIKINGDMISKDSVLKFMHENFDFFESTWLINQILIIYLLMFVNRFKFSVKHQVILCGEYFWVLVLSQSFLT